MPFSAKQTKKGETRESFTPDDRWETGKLTAKIGTFGRSLSLPKSQTQNAQSTKQAKADGIWFWYQAVVD